MEPMEPSAAAAAAAAEARSGGCRIELLLRACESAFGDLLRLCPAEVVDDQHKVVWVLHHAGLCSADDEVLICGEVPEDVSKEFLERVLDVARLHSPAEGDVESDDKLSTRPLQDIVHSLSNLCLRDEILNGSLLSFPVDIPLSEPSKENLDIDIHAELETINREISETNAELSSLDASLSSVEVDPAAKKAVLDSLSSCLRSLAELVSEFLSVHERSFEPFIARTPAVISDIGAASHETSAPLAVFHNVVRGVAVIHHRISGIAALSRHLTTKLELSHSKHLSDQATIALEDSFRLLQESMQSKATQAEQDRRLQQMLNV